MHLFNDGTALYRYKYRIYTRQKQLLCLSSQSNFLVFVSECVIVASLPNGKTNTLLVIIWLMLNIRHYQFLTLSSQVTFIYIAHLNTTGVDPKRFLMTNYINTLWNKVKRYNFNEVLFILQASSSAFNGLPQTRTQGGGVKSWFIVRFADNDEWHWCSTFPCRRSPRVFKVITGVTCAHWFLKAQQVCSLSQPQSPISATRGLIG